MTHVKWAPIRRRPAINMFNNLDRMLAQMTNTPPAADGGNWYPNLDIRESKTSFGISVDLPGLEKKDIDISLSEGILTITGERKSKDLSENENCLRSEVTYGKFQRSFTITEDVDESKIKAKFKNGVLSLTIIKMEKVSPEIKQIAIS